MTGRWKRIIGSERAPATSHLSALWRLHRGHLGGNGGSTRAVVNVNCLSDRGHFTSTPAFHDFEGETIETRSSRRATNWMPATIRR